MKIDWEQLAFIIGFVVLVTGLVQCHQQDQITSQHKATIELQREQFEAEMALKRFEIELANKQQQENENAQKTTP